MFNTSRSFASFALVAALGSVTGLAQAQQHQEEARVVSSTQTSDGSFTVTY